MYAAVVGEKFTENVLLEGVTYIFIFYYTWLLLKLVYDRRQIMLHMGHLIGPDIASW